MELEIDLTDNFSEIKTNPRWTQERVKLLRELRLAGKSASFIAKELGAGFTRNAIAGKVWRENIGGPNRSHSTLSAEQRRINRNKRERRKRLAAEMAGLQASEPMGMTDIASDFGDNPMTIERLEAHNCRWPVEGWGATMVYCGGNRMHDKCSYCERHWARSIDWSAVRVR